MKEDELRAAIDRFRLNKHIGTESYKPYVDVFRRLRELQGEEGITGIGIVMSVITSKVHLAVGVS